MHEYVTQQASRSYHPYPTTLPHHLVPRYEVPAKSVWVTPYRGWPFNSAAIHVTRIDVH